MRFFFRKSRKAPKTSPNRESTRQSAGDLTISKESRGHNPYDTLPGVARENFGMRRRDDGKWSF